jgi:hypothetical protein
MQEKQYYVYTHARPGTTDIHGVYYIGKGLKYRTTDFVKRNPHHKNITNKYGRENIIVRRIPCTDETHAFKLEVEMIAAMKRLGVNLANMTDGGEGTSGWVPHLEWRLKRAYHMRGKKHTPESLAKMREARSKQVFSVETRKKISESIKNLPQEVKDKIKAASANRPPVTDETRKKQSIARMLWLETHNAYRPTEEQRRRSSELRMGKKLSEEARANLREKRKAYVMPEGLREKFRQLGKERGFSPETRAKIAETRRLKSEALRLDKLLNPRPPRPKKPRKPKSEWKQRSPVSEETKQKLREANIGKKASDATKAKMSATHKQRQAENPRSAETRAKLAYNAANVSEETKAKRNATRAAKKALIPEDERLRVEKERRDLKNKKRRERKEARRLAEGIKPRPADCWERTAATRKANRDPNLTPEHIAKLDARCAKRAANKAQKLNP